jgi:hypothetical protein
VSGQFLIQRMNKTRIQVPFENLKSCKGLDWAFWLRAPDERRLNCRVFCAVGYYTRSVRLSRSVRADDDCNNSKNVKKKGLNTHINRTTYETIQILPVASASGEFR